MSFYRFLAYLGIAYYVVFFSLHFIYLLLGYRSAVRWKKLGDLEETHRLSRSEIVTPVSLLAELDLGGEEAVQWIDHLLAQRFPEMELLVLVRGGDERAVQALVKTYFLRRVDRVYRRVLETPSPREVYQSDDRRLTFLILEPMRRGMALNVALNLARYPLVAVAGRRVSLEDEALLRVVRPFMEGGPWVPAAMGTVLPAQMEGGSRLPRRRLTRLCLMEALRLQLAFQAGNPSTGGPVISYNSLLLFHKKDLVRAGGFDPELPLMGAEMDMFLRLHRLMREEKTSYRFAFLPQLVCRTPFPERWVDHFRISSERRRGVSAALWRGRDMVFNARFGALGLFLLPIFCLFVYLAAVVGLAAYAVAIALFVTGKTGPVLFGAFLASALIYPGLVGMGAVFAARRELGVLEGHGVQLYGYAFLSQLWFRQLTAVASLFPFAKGSGEG